MCCLLAICASVAHCTTSGVGEVVATPSVNCGVLCGEAVGSRMGTVPSHGCYEYHIRRSHVAVL